jgi:hypothetical protein
MKKGKLIVKFLVEAFVGLTMVVICLRMLSILILMIKDNSTMRILLLGLSFFLSVFVTCKILRYIHKYLEIDFGKNGEQ